MLPAVLEMWKRRDDPGQTWPNKLIHVHGSKEKLTVCKRDDRMISELNGDVRVSAAASM